MAMEMAMRACYDTPMSQDLTPPIPPLAAALHAPFLGSRCSSCFHHLPSTSNPNPNPNCSLPCPGCAGSVNYCSLTCLTSDSVPHTSSGECRFFSQAEDSQPDCSIGNSTDLRVALRLLHLLERNGDLRVSDRIGGLMVGDLGEVLEEGGELAEEIEDNALLMVSVRSGRSEAVTGGARLEMMVLLAVMRNSVEVQISEGWSVGVTVYGPRFSWFNHSCAPNAFYRFQLYEPASPESSRFWVVPCAMGETEDMEVGLDSKEDTMNQGHCIFGPRVVVRSIKPIKKGDEVCITYTDLLQPKGTRHVDLWSKYRFTCQCSRCTESPQSYVDHILTCNARTIDSREGTTTCINLDSGYEHLTDAVQEAIEEYRSSDNPKLCCMKLEIILSQNSLSNSLRANEIHSDRFCLHPLHHLSLMAYMTLASAYRLRSQISENEQSSDLSRISVAYSTLLCLSAYQLFLCDPSLMAPTSHFLMSGGEAMLNLVGNQIMEHSVSSSSQLHINRDALSQLEFQSNTRQFVECVLELLPQCWPFLVHNSLYLENLESPTKLIRASFGNNQPNKSLSKQICVACVLTSDKFDEEHNKYMNIYKLAVHWLTHGMYLASICYGHDCHLINKAKSLLNC